MDKESIVYDILEKLGRGEEANFIEYGIDQKEFGDIVEECQNNGYIEEAGFSRAKGEIRVTFLNKAKLTSKGIKYVQDYSKSME